MKSPVAISLWEPWATLWVHGFKKNETRSWRHNRAGEWVMVHAGKHWTTESKLMCIGEPFESALESIGFDFSGTRHSQILGLVKLTHPWRVPTGDIDFFDAMLSPIIKESESELTFGDYSPGRWVWPTEDYRVVFDAPVPCPGKQGFFTPPDDVIDDIAAKLIVLELDPAAFGF